MNFGEIGTLRIDAPVETFGHGALGFNVYDGSLQEVSFESITAGCRVTALGEASDVVRAAPELAEVIAGLTIEGR